MNKNKLIIPVVSVTVMVTVLSQWRIINSWDDPVESFFFPDIPCKNLSEPIDAVYTWVNGSDPEFISSIRKWTNKEHVNIPSSRRFEDFDQLRYSLRSLTMYAPWIRYSMSHISHICHSSIGTFIWLQMDKFHRG